MFATCFQLPKPLLLFHFIQGTFSSGNFIQGKTHHYTSFHSGHKQTFFQYDITKYLLQSFLNFISLRYQYLAEFYSSIILLVYLHLAYLLLAYLELVYLLFPMVCLSPSQLLHIMIFAGKKMKTAKQKVLHGLLLPRYNFYRKKSKNQSKYKMEKAQLQLLSPYYDFHQQKSENLSRYEMEKVHLSCSYYRCITPDVVYGTSVSKYAAAPALRFL